uniref:Uncharacterized protein n=1 Tax=Physcomitrium patens TaxID=3218 RepID=A0A7I4A6Q4_PHYPA
MASLWGPATPFCAHLPRLASLPRIIRLSNWVPLILSNRRSVRRECSESIAIRCFLPFQSWVTSNSIGFVLTLQVPSSSTPHCQHT